MPKTQPYNDCYLVLFRDEYPNDVWEEYCNITGCCPDSEWIQIRFNRNEVESSEVEE